MIKTAHINFQFSIFNFQSNLNVLKFKFKNSLKISNFKFQIILLSFLFLFLSSAIPVFAQTTAPPLNTNPDVPNNMHTYTQNVMIEVMAAMTCQLTGVDPVNPSQQCLGIDSASKKIGFVDLPSSTAGSGQAGGAIGFAGNMIAVLYTPPLHTGDYFNYLAQNFGIAKPAYAQTGKGFEGLSPLIKIWSAFRNIVYLLFVIVFVIIGVAIMLRLHIDPRTVMTIENQIPKIIIGLVMVTFSFAIAGFLIDMMYVSIYTVHGVVKDMGITEKDASGKVKNVADEFNPTDMQGKSPFAAVGGLGSPWPTSTGGINGIVNSAALSVSGILKSSLGIGSFIPISFENVVKIEGGSLTLVPFKFKEPDVSFAPPEFKPEEKGGALSWIIDIISLSVSAGIARFTGAVINVPLFGAVPSLAAAALSFPTLESTLREFLPWFIPYLVLLIAVLWALFRLWFQLIIAYIYILIDVVFAPFWILAGLFPGSPIGFGAWLRDIVANLSAFPVTIVMFMLGKVFMSAFAASGPDRFVPPLIGDLGDVNLLGSLIGIGIILMTPQVVTMMRDFLKAPNLKYTAAIGQAVGVGAGGGKGVISTTALGAFGRGSMEQQAKGGLGQVLRKIAGI